MGNNVSTSENADIELHIRKWNSDHSSALFLSATVAFCYKNIQFCRVHSEEMLQQFRAVSSGRKKEKWRKPQFKYRRRNNEASS